MTPDEVVKVLQNCLELAGTSTVCISNEEKQAIQSAIILIQDYTRMRDYAQECCTIKSKAEKNLQDYQKLRERVSVENINKFIEKNDGDMFITFNNNTQIAQSIVTYLGGGKK